MVSPPMISAYHGNEQNWRKENNLRCKNSVKILKACAVAIDMTGPAR